MSDPTQPSPQSSPPPRRADALAERPSSATVGLLEHITAHAVDEDYAFVSARRESGAAPDRPAGRPGIGVLGALVMALFAALVITAAAQTSRNAGDDARERDNLAAQVRSAQRELSGDYTALAELRLSVATLQARQLAGDRNAQGLLAQLQRLGVLTGSSPVRGPGVRVVADDAPDAQSARNEVLDTDLQKLVNGFWEAGAEAISLNGQRLTNLSTIRTAGGAITVNARSLRAPYVLLVVGNKDTLPARFAESSSGQAWLVLQRDVGLRLTMTASDSLRLPASAVSLRYAKNPRAGGAQ